MDRSEKDQKAGQASAVFNVKRRPLRLCHQMNVLLILSVVFLSSCASFSGPALQPEIRGLVAADRMKLAVDKLSAQSAAYGQGNYLLYYLDRGLVEYYAGLNAQSILSFEKAKIRFEELYTQSLSKEALSWTVNDYALPYRGSDYEYLLINVFQALNYLALGNVNEALVEARDMDSKYGVIEKIAGAAKRQRFEDNGFARMFMGFVYESTGRPEYRDSASLFYRQAADVYQEYYGGGYAPEILQDRLRAATAGERNSRQAVVYVFQLAGLAPLKSSEMIPVPVDGEFIVPIAFPKFNKRDYETRQGVLTAEGPVGVKHVVPTELGVSIEELAVKDLESRKAIVLSKAALRPALKYLIERKQKENIEKKFGRMAADIFGLFGSLYNILSERADLRSWQTLPAEIRVARLTLDPGDYQLRVEHLAGDGSTLESSDLGFRSVEAGNTYFFVSRARR